ncbi:TrmH family RNA methyltransferase [Flavobacterium sp. UBA6135]|uniref:TrmH family RNA methyltransferase n=1 Tax=Flavobacterium sp. UBA6135 TaxID=1946553 RepID=UPI0025C50B72|nr:RNA methyltransferase [Flavobacterium sp. UBA6135]
MVSKNQIKLIISLRQKKFRVEHQMFIAEGFKVISEFIEAGFELLNLYVTDSNLFDNDEMFSVVISEQELKKMSALVTPNNCLAVFKIPKAKPFSDSGLVVALDDIRDPGNLGTIIRLCDWFGIEQLFCSETTVDVYNPKVIQSTMGSVSRVAVVYGDLAKMLKTTTLPIYGTFMDENSIYSEDFSKEGIIIMGNEANGISEGIACLVQHKITIPRFGAIQKTESLNVATATAIVLSEIQRKINGK